MFKHWRWETDREDLAWLTFDKAGESTNTFSREALEELGRERSTRSPRTAPKGLVIRSAKDNFIAGADIEEFTRIAGPEEALEFVRRGWDAVRTACEPALPHLAR
jgi:3-hydroxyacyl-CoA dehydrogenase / enoyl-CoA hydratase / 3-hydroxybutyryl-CoA epimerase